MTYDDWFLQFSTAAVINTTLLHLATMIQLTDADKLNTVIVIYILPTAPQHLKSLNSAGLFK